MKIGVPTEIKSQENRVAITPAGVHHLTLRDHQVLVQAGAGIGSAMTDDAFRQAGATIVPTAADVWGAADLLLKVKEPIAAEYGYLRPDQVLFTYLHLAADQPQTEALLTIYRDRGLLVEVDAIGEVEAVSQRLIAALDAKLSR